TIGGLLGEVVYVSTADDLVKQLDSVGAQTIVITGDIDMQSKGNTRIRDNKTIVGCYGSHTIYDCQLRTNDAYGAEDDSPSDNIVFRNLKMVAKNTPNRILINIWSSRQIWIDHIYFESQLTYDRTGNGQDEVGKFIWINTPYESYRDAKDRLRSPDYVTISYCHLKHRYWTVAYGTQNSEITRDRTTLLYNWWDENVRRCPQLGNGSAHIYNNYYSAYGTSSNGSGTTGIIGGDGSNFVSENNYFNGYSLQQALMMGGGSDPCRDSNSYLSETLNGTPSKISFSPKTTSTWYPNKSNYGYELLDAYNTKNTDTKAFCTAYSGDCTKASQMKYITDSDFSGWISTKYESPFLRKVDFSAVTASSFANGATYRIKNVNSGLYMQVEGAKSENGANIQQWETNNHNCQKWIMEKVEYPVEKPTEPPTEAPTEAPTEPPTEKPDNPVTDIPVPPIGTQILLGDANVDGKVSISDAVRILQYIANAQKYPLDETAKINADVFDIGSGVTANDAALIQAVDAGVE
ncbi:MAG: RICIN domain-containing protein, partial [Acutalibacteraceae bacterium]|nr:RICIN domain-containing protein [Acutalibacteraceae bacterium]